jgi:hypothetical protein
MGNPSNLIDSGVVTWAAGNGDAKTVQLKNPSVRAEYYQIKAKNNSASSDVTVSPNNVETWVSGDLSTPLVPASDQMVVGDGETGIQNVRGMFIGGKGSTITFTPSDADEDGMTVEYKVFKV